MTVPLNVSDPAAAYGESLRVMDSNPTSVFTPEPGAVAERTVLVAEDDNNCRRALQHYLERSGYQVIEAASVSASLDAVFAHPTDLVILDFDLGGGTSDVLTKIRRRSSVPVIVCSGQSSERERVGLLNLGADDVLAKPYSFAELEARMRAVLRRGSATPTTTLDHGDLVIDQGTRRVTVGDAEVVMTRKEFDLLAFLASAPGRVFSREDLLERVWGSNGRWQGRSTVTEHIRRVRLKIESDPENPRLDHDDQRHRLPIRRAGHVDTRIPLTARARCRPVSRASKSPTRAWTWQLAWAWAKMALFRSSWGAGPMARDVGGALVGPELAETDRWPLVGRSSEITQLKVSISGRRGAVITGSAGVGKTVLATVGVEFARELGMSVALVAGTDAARPYAFGAFASLLHRDSDLVGPESHADQLRRYMHELLDDAGQRPLLLLVDDAHLLDDGSASLVHQLVQAGSATVLACVLSSGRAGQPGVDPWWSSGRTTAPRGSSSAPSTTRR